MQTDSEKLKDLRETRNRIIHYGFSPRDDKECGRLLVETGLPFVTALYRELFGFHLNWRDARSGVKNFKELSPQEAACVGLDLDVADQIQIVNSILRNQGVRNSLPRPYPPSPNLPCYRREVAGPVEYQSTHGDRAFPNGAPLSQLELQYTAGGERKSWD
jgi:hypothetical protein